MRFLHLPNMRIVSIWVAKRLSNHCPFHETILSLSRRSTISNRSRSHTTDSTRSKRHNLGTIDRSNKTSLRTSSSVGRAVRFSVLETFWSGPPTVFYHLFDRKTDMSFFVTRSNYYSRHNRNYSHSTEISPTLPKFLPLYT